MDCFVVQGGRIRDDRDDDDSVVGWLGWIRPTHQGREDNRSGPRDDSAEETHIRCGLVGWVWLCVCKKK